LKKTAPTNDFGSLGRKEEDVAHTIPARLCWTNGELTQMPEGVDPTATEVQVQGANGWIRFVYTEEIDEEGFVIFAQASIPSNTGRTLR